MKRPKYRKHTTRDVAFVEFNGKRHYLPGVWKSPESNAAYRAFLLDNGLLYLEPPDGKPRYVADVLSAFTEWANATYPPGVRSEAACCRAAVGHLARRYGTMLLRDFGPTKIKDLQLQLAHENKSRGYINSVCSRLKRAFKWAVSEELIPPAMYLAIATVPGLRKGRTAAKEPPKRQPVKWEHVAPVLKELSPTVAAMVAFQWHTGVRSQSICSARASQFDRSQKPWIWKPKHKLEHRDQDLTVFVGPKAQKIIKDRFDGRDFLFAPVHQNGRRAKGYRSFYDSVSYLRAVHRAIDRVNSDRAAKGLKPIPHWTPHQIRHAYLTRIREAYGLEAAQAAGGHARLQATQIYAQRLLEKAKQVAKEVG